MSTKKDELQKRNYLLDHSKYEAIILFVLGMLLFCGCGQNDVNILDANKSLQWKWVIEPLQYQDLFFVDDDLIAVQREDGKWGVLNLLGEEQIAFKYDYITEFNQGMTVVRTNDNYEFLNRDGEPLKNLLYKNARGFHELMAGVEVNDMWGYIDITGIQKIPCIYTEITDFSENTAAVKEKGKWGYIDSSGNQIIDFIFDDATPFKEGRAIVAIEGLYGVIDISGEMIVDLKYERIREFQNGYAAALYKGKWGFLDTKGKPCIPFIYDEVGNFSEGKAAVKVCQYRDGLDQWAYIDTNGNIVIDYYPYEAIEGKMVHVGEFHDGLAFVTKDVYCIIDKNGQDIFNGDSYYFISSFIYNPQYDVLPGYKYIDSKMTQKKYGLIGVSGEERIPAVFDYIYGFHENYVIVANIVEDKYRCGLIELF
ncbi:MAG: WG repeat-containing protein [Acetatifactor sp.]|nr:WG repeat-containing protein [Acetatifactor sp.]